MFEKTKAFWIGFTGGFAGSLQFLSVSLYDLVFLFPLKLLAAILLSFFTGIATLLANSFYENVMKEKIDKVLKKKKKVKKKENEANS